MDPATPIEQDELPAALLRGPGDAVPATPSRAPGSVRRTMSSDITRPDGLLGPIVADLRAQDVRTDADGRPEVIERLSVRLGIDLRTGVITEVDLGDGSAGVPDLVGTSVRSGYGRRLAELDPEGLAARSLAAGILEDLGGAFLVSGYALLRGGGIPRSSDQLDRQLALQSNICRGWAEGGPLLDALRTNGRSPLPLGPMAPALDADDPVGWHVLAPLAAPTVRRLRRLDVVPVRDGSHRLRVNSHFRDSYAGDDGEMVMHEYLVDAMVDRVRRIAEIHVAPRVLPWGDCPGAVASAGAVVGMGIDELPGRVRTDLVGPSTCTHLNSTLRCLADTGALAAQLTLTG